MSKSALLALSWASLAFGATYPSTAGFADAFTGPSKGGSAVCVSGFVNVTASTTKNIKFDFEVPKNQTAATGLFVDYLTSGSPVADEIEVGYLNVSGTYKLGATLCTPANNTSPTSIQPLTHGIGFDRYYWDFSRGYSYVDAAAEAGYATFLYDRLGVGASEKADPINALQAGLESAIAASLATALREGTFSGLTPSHIIGVGHSFGSIITQAVTSTSPSLLSAAILTGYSANSTADPTFLAALNLRIASEQDPVRFANLPPGYLASSTSVSDQFGFFRYPGFDPLVLAAAEASKGTTSYGELFSLSAVTAVAENYTNPVAVVNGANDFPFCFGNCSYPTNLAAAVAPAQYPNVPTNKTGSYLAPVTGHGVNLHYNAGKAYTYILEFLKAQGL